MLACLLFPDFTFFKPTDNTFKDYIKIVTVFYLIKKKPLDGSNPILG